MLVSQGIEWMVGCRTLETDQVFVGWRPDNYDRYMVFSIFDPFAMDLKAHRSVFFAKDRPRGGATFNHLFNDVTQLNLKRDFLDQSVRLTPQITGL